MSADTSWKIHLSALKEKRRVHSQKASSQVESSSMLKVVSPGTPIAGDDNSDIAIVDDASEDISLRDSYLQRKILDELSASTTWLAASLEADADYQSRSRSDNIHDITPDAKQLVVTFTSGGCTRIKVSCWIGGLGVRVHVHGRYHLTGQLHLLTTPVEFVFVSGEAHLYTPVALLHVGTVSEQRCSRHC